MSANQDHYVLSLKKKNCHRVGAFLLMGVSTVTLSTILWKVFPNKVEVIKTETKTEIYIPKCENQSLVTKDQTKNKTKFLLLDDPNEVDPLDKILADQKRVNEFTRKELLKDKEMLKNER
jgi:hypothetical protein